MMGYNARYSSNIGSLRKKLIRCSEVTLRSSNKIIWKLQ